MMMSSSFVPPQALGYSGAPAQGAGNPLANGAPQRRMPVQLNRGDDEEGDGPPAPQGGGGMMSALGLNPNKLAMLSRSLAGGMSAVKNSPFAGQSFANALGGSLGGGNTYEDEMQKRADALSEKSLDRGVTMRGQDITSETARRGQDINDKYHQGILDQGNFVWQEGTDPETGKAGVFKFDKKTGTRDFTPGMTLPKVTGGRSPGDTRQFVIDLQRENPGLSTADALEIVKRGGKNADMIRLRGEEPGNPSRSEAIRCLMGMGLSAADAERKQAGRKEG
jgi:hypothetical protein